jgi:hypothetical protein
MDATVVHRVDLDPGKLPPDSPFCAQVIDWAEIHKARQLEYGFLKARQQNVDHGPALPMDLGPLWP